MIREKVLLRAKDGDAAAQAMAAFQYFKDNDFEQALYWAQKAADQNEPNGLYLLGCFYFNGQGVEADYERGLELLRRSAALGCRQAVEALRQKGVLVNADSADGDGSADVEQDEPVSQVSSDQQIPSAPQASSESVDENVTNVDDEPETDEIPQDFSATIAAGDSAVIVAESASEDDGTAGGDEAVSTATPVLSASRRVKVPKEREKELKEQVKAERAKLKRKKMRKRIDRRKRGLKVFGKIMMVVGIVLLAIVIFFAVIYFIPFKSPRSAWNEYNRAIWFGDIDGVKNAMYFPTESAENVFDERYPDNTYFDEFVFVFGIMMPSKISADGDTATAMAHVVYVYKSDSYSGSEYFHSIELRFVRTEDGDWKIANEYPLPRLRD